MRAALIPDLDHFRWRVVQDALTEATAAYWRRRAAAFDAAMPRDGDYPGQATSAQIEATRRRVAAVALACRHRATITGEPS